VTKLTVNSCQLCNSEGEDLLWQDSCCRIIRVADENYPGFCRVILQDHVREMTDLGPGRRERLMQAVFATEAALRQLMTPDKINLASLGNVVPHLHWHVVPRFTDDRHFPNPIWGDPTRMAAAHSAPDKLALSALLQQALA
jgi:diadenosine tetraphosphate (Ap4A) HIT family hydrolase